MKINEKKVIKIIVHILVAILTIVYLWSFFSNAFAIDNAGEAERELYGEDENSVLDTNTAEETAYSTAKIDGQEVKIYTIMDMFFNRIPLLDTNFFTDTAGGKPVQDGSALQIIRLTVATWYYAFYNVALVCMAIIIIYVGMRMALATISSDKAKYKEMLVGWIKALAIVLTMHYMMYGIQYLNSTLLEIIERGLPGEYQTTVDPVTGEETGGTGTLYTMILKRAFSNVFKVGIPAAIIYLVLCIFFIRFLEVYAKRYALVTVLTVLAPLIAIKHGIQSVGGRGSGEFSRWLNSYLQAVIIQSIHAIVFVVIICPSINLAFENFIGFIIAILMLHSVLKLNKIAVGIFNFEGGGGKGGVGELLSPEGPEALSRPENLMKAKLAIDLTKKFGHGAAGIARGVSNTALMTKVKDKIDNSKLVTNARSKIQAELRKAALEDKEGTLTDDATDGRRPLMNAARRDRRRGRGLFRGGSAASIAARIAIKGYKKLPKGKMFKAKAGMILAASEMLLGIPTAIAYDSELDVSNLGLIMMGDGYSRMMKKMSEMESQKKRDKNEKKGLEALESVMTGNEALDRFNESRYQERQAALESGDQEALKAIDEQTALIAEFWRELDKFSTNSYSINQALTGVLFAQGITEINDDNIDDIVDEVAKKLDIKDTFHDKPTQTLYKTAIKSVLDSSRDEINATLADNPDLFDDELMDHDVLANDREFARAGDYGFGAVVAFTGESGDTEEGARGGRNGSSDEPSGRFGDNTRETNPDNEQLKSRYDTELDSKKRDISKTYALYIAETDETKKEELGKQLENDYKELEKTATKRYELESDESKHGVDLFIHDLMKKDSSLPADLKEKIKTMATQSEERRKASQPDSDEDEGLYFIGGNPRSGGTGAGASTGRTRSRNYTFADLAQRMSDSLHQTTASRLGIVDDKVIQSARTFDVTRNANAISNKYAGFESYSTDGIIRDIAHL